MEIVVTQTRSGLWTGRVQEGWNVAHKVNGHDREEVLLKLLALMHVKVTYTGEHWINDGYVEWKKENQL